MRARLAVLLAALILALVPAVASAQPAPYCRPGQAPAFAFGFAALKAQLGARMGDPTSCEYGDPRGSGDTLQDTTAGLSFYRRSTNTPTFTNGFEHWGLTPGGLVAWTGDSIDPPPAVALGGPPIDPQLAPLQAFPGRALVPPASLRPFSAASRIRVTQGEAQPAGRFYAVEYLDDRGSPFATVSGSIGRAWRSLLAIGPDPCVGRAYCAPAGAPYEEFRGMSVRGAPAVVEHGVGAAGNTWVVRWEDDATDQLHRMTLQGELAGAYGVTLGAANRSSAEHLAALADQFIPIR